MSTNILLNEQGNEPLRSENEYFILKRQDISYLILSQSGDKYVGEGSILITSNRLVLLPIKQNTNIRAIEIPLNQIYEEEFKQPLFGKNYIKGKCRPFLQNQFGNFTFTIWFKGKRIGTLVGVFFTLIDSLRKNQGKNHNINILQNLKENNFNAIFAIDTGDESFIYKEQPSSANIQKQKFQSVIINRPNNFNNINHINIIGQNNNINNDNNNFENFSRLNEDKNHANINNIYMSNFFYKKPDDKFIYKDPGFEYKEPVYDINQVDKPSKSPNNANSEENIYNDNINNIYNDKYINNNINYINNNIIDNRINNNINNEVNDDYNLVTSYYQQKKNQQNNININNNIININDINNNANYNYIHDGIDINNNNIQNQYINRNIQLNNDIIDTNLDNTYQINSQNLNGNNNIDIHNSNINQKYYRQNNYKNNSNNYKILNYNMNKDKYEQLKEEIFGKDELNSKNELNNNNDLNQSDIIFENKADLIIN